MPWWKSTNSPSSSSPSPVGSASSPRRPRKEFASIFTRKSSSASASPSAAASSGDAFAQPRLTRQWNFRRHIEDVDVASPDSFNPTTSSASTPVSRSPSNLDLVPSRSSSSPVLLPQPLPLPGNSPQSPTRREVGFSPAGCRLPSPRERDEGTSGLPVDFSSEAVARYEGFE